MSFNILSSKKRTFDAIVIGSGISGGWAAKELTERKMKTLVLERGRQIRHIADYHTALNPTWTFDHRLTPTQKDKAANPTQSKCYAWNEGTQHLFVKDEAQPYNQVKPFDWIRGYQVGGKSLMWARQCYRWNEKDFEANLRENVGTDWAIRYKDIASWYTYAEQFAGISGNKDGLEQIPDGDFLPPMDLNCVELHLKSKIESNFSDRKLVIGRSANLTKAIHGRGPCQHRDLCYRGCPFGGYFSSNSATLPAAEKTGKMTLMPDSIAHSIIYDEKQQRATGVRVINAETKEMTEYYAKVIFVGAATLNSNALLLNSTSNRFPNGLGNDSETLGHYIMCHNYRARASAEIDGHLEEYYYGKRPNSFYIPRFRNWGNDKQANFLRGYSIAGSATRADWNGQTGKEGIGAAYKKMLTEPGGWSIYMGAMGEMLPDYSNKVSIDRTKTDNHGMPLLNIDVEWKANEDAMTKDMLETMTDMLDKAGFKNIRASDSKQAPGLDIHEMGGCRMGSDPKAAMLNGFNQMHAVKNVFVTDGSAFSSQACQNPSISYMALTARACDYAVKEMKKRNL
jgi:choline dehydrogenase-like flavoprotein